MRTTLGSASFETPSRLRDDSTYIFAADDESASLRVTPDAESRDAKRSLDEAKAALDEMFGPLVIYSNEIRMQAPGIASVPAYEGEIADPATSVPRRFGLISLSAPAAIYTFALFGPRRGFLQEFARLVMSVRFRADSSESTTLREVQGKVRRSAAGATFEVPADWSCPTSLLFTDPGADDVLLRMTTEEPPCDPGVVDMAADIPSNENERVVVLNQIVEAVAPPHQGWKGQWTVEHHSARGTRLLLLRKACIVFAADPLTVYARCLQKNDSRVASAWASILASLRDAQ